MDLFSITLEGFRRFRERTTLRTNGKLIALLGPNESGKSSIIDGLMHLGKAEAFAASDISRGGTSDDLALEGRFLLSDSELVRAGLSGPRWMTVKKKFDGTRYYGFIPSAPVRDTAHRYTAIQPLLDILHDGPSCQLIEEVEGGLAGSLHKLILDVGVASPNLSEELLDKLRSSLSLLEQVPKGRRTNQIQKTIDSWTKLIALEIAPTPTRRAINILSRETPELLLFDDEQRSLASSYSISDLRGVIPPALAGLAEVARLTFGDLFSAIDAGDGGRLTTLEYRANRVLKQRFMEMWRQSGITIALRLSTTLLTLQVINEGDEFTGLDERSDGLRQFIALQAFALKTRSKNPILLIDEAEQRLHYDAQADLVQMLAKQSVAPKVIYTTHSAGCLPEDLGNGVRLVAVDSGRPSYSIIRNKFWQSDAAGFAPLLVGMGASTLAFFPTRRAVLVEGPGDMLLYPTMFREVSDQGALGFQFVPGLSAAARALAPIIPSAAAHVGYLTDGDAGGLDLRRQLLEANVPPERVVTLRNSDNSAVEIEDFIDPALLLKAANSLLTRFHAGVGELAQASLALRNRMASLEAAYEQLTGVELPKVGLAYEILDLLEASPGLTILDRRRKNAFTAVVGKVQNIFESRRAADLA